MDSGLIAPSHELRRLPPFALAVVCIAGTALLIGLGFGVAKIRVEILLLAATAALGVVARSFGVSWRELQAGMLQSMLKGLPAMLIVVVVGALIGTWLAAGTIPMLIYYGLGLISPKFFLLTASVATGIVSVLTGTGYGTIGTVGVAFMGIAHGLGVAPGAAAGALVAGAYLGDKISPFAANANFAVAVARVNIYDHIRHCLWTTVPGFCLGLIVYLVAGGALSGGGSTSLAAAETLRTALATHFRFSAWLLLPPVLTLALALGNRPVLPGMLLSVAVAAVLAVTVQHLSPVAALNVAVAGYEPHLGNPAADLLLAQGGMERMMRVTLIALIAFAFSGVLQKAGLLQPILEPLYRVVTTPRRLVAASAFTCVLVELCTGAAFVCILLPTEIFAPAYRRMKLAGKNLTRVIGDCGIVGVPLLPWSIAGAFMSGTLGVPVLQYAPWAVFCYAGLALTLVVGLTGLTLAPRRRDDETQPGS